MPLFRSLVFHLLLGVALAAQASDSLLPLASSSKPAEEPVGISEFSSPREIREDLPPLPTIDLTAPADDVWERMRNGFSMPDLNSPLVADHQAWYLNRPELLKRIFDRSRRYLYHIVQELEKRGMPTELALLPVIESSFSPTAYSSARALGMWQFIPSTGRNFKLQQNAWFDQRRDIIASTNAALDYLQQIYEMHGDWHLALASYNWGEGSVAKAIAKNRTKGMPTDYLSLKMPAETQNYVPKLQAIKNIVAQPELFGLKLDPIPNQPYFSAVERSVDENMDISVVAKLAEIPLDEFIALNPAYSRPVIPGSARSPLALPTDKVETYLNNLQNHEAQDKPLSNWLTYTLKKGERIDAVANRFGIAPAKLKQLNGINARTKVTPGFTLLIPGKGAAGYEALAAKLPQTPSKAPKAAKSKKGKKVSSGKPTVAKADKAPRKPGKPPAKIKGKSGKATAPSKKKPHKG